MLKLIAAAACAWALSMAAPLSAQGLFSPVIDVNGDPITRFELEQRAAMLRVLRAPGNAEDTARTQLIEDRLKRQAAARAGLLPDETQILDGMTEFAQRANLSREDFIAALAAEGVAEETFRDFVISGLAWRDLVGRRFGPRARVSEEEIDRALSRGSSNAGVRVLLSEIMMPLLPGQDEDVNARAREISQTTSIAEFANAARNFSATATWGDGGRLPWQNLADLPAQLRPLVLGLAPGEVTDPINLPEAVALFQLRAIEELPYAPPPVAAIEYAAYYMPGGRSAETLARAENIAARVDRCDDLYGIAKGQPAEQLERGTLPVDELPQDIALELAKLDPGEVSTALTRANGQTLVFLMLCGRTPVLDLPEDTEPAPAPAAPTAEGEEAAPVEVDPVAEARREIGLGLRNRRLATLADGFLAQLLADARIVEY